MNTEKRPTPKLKLGRLHRFAGVFVLAFVLAAGAIFAPTANAQSGGFSGKVRTQRGAGIPNATVVARQDGKNVRSAVTDRSGNFRMTGLSSGKYNVVFEADGYQSGVLYNVEVGRSVRNLGNRLVLGVDQGTLVLIRGSVFYKEGFGLAGARIELEEVAVDGTVKSLGSTVSSGTGEFNFRRPEGSAKLRVTARFKNATASKEVDVDGAAIYRTAITLDVSRGSN
ncbi:MAG: carboxypeptidase regulatory-like domain-containing protein [Blastocatellia bacterium]|nr:carboxypeptidase regulatory-like domain-containing protein [Blastocatellia bacterium]